MMNKPNSKKSIYNLNLVLQETGIKADTLRAWERRYQLPNPNRTEGGHRLFSEYDIETIKWLIARQEEGVRISQAVELWREIESRGKDPLGSLDAVPGGETIGDISEQERENFSILRDRWIQACLDFDELSADQILNQSFACFSLEVVCTEILQSGLSEIGSLWYQGKASVQQEHFASELALRRLHTLILSTPQSVRDLTILVGCPPGENHTFSALMITLLLRHRSWNVIYLGANVPNDHLKETIDKTNPELVVMTSMRLATSSTLYDTALFLRKFDVPLAFGGWAFNNIPGLSQKIHGYYLGEDLIGAVSAIEDLISSPMPPIELDGESDKYIKAIALFIENRHQIELQTLEQLKEILGSGFPFGDIEQANGFLAEDIVAALSLGDISLLGSNLDWVQSLIPSRDLPREALSTYLRVYFNAAQTYLGIPGQPIIDWLAPIINSN